MPNERHQNPSAERKGPERSGSAADGTASPDRSTQADRAAEPSASAAREGVRMGYEVIDRHTQEGREEAWQRSRAASDPGPGPASGFGLPGGAWPGAPWAMPALGALLGPWLQLLQMPARMFEAGLGGRTTPPPTGSWGPFTSGVSRPPPGRASSGSSSASSSTASTGAQAWAHGSYTPTIDPRAASDPAAPATNAATGSSPGSLRTLSVRMTSGRPTQVDVALPSLPGTTEVQVMALAPVDGDHAPLPEVSLHSEPGRIIVGIVVPDDQPPGRYAGAVLRDDGTALGSISVDISDP